MNKKQDSRFRLDRLEFGDVIARNIALLSGPFALGQPPVTLGVVYDLQVLSLPEAQILIRAGVVIVQGDEDLRGRDVRVRDLRDRPYGIRRWRRHRINLRDRLDSLIAVPLLLLLPLDRRFGATDPHSWSLSILLVYSPYEMDSPSSQDTFTTSSSSSSSPSHLTTRRPRSLNTRTRAAVRKYIIDSSNYNETIDVEYRTCTCPGVTESIRSCSRVIHTQRWIHEIRKIEA